MAKQQGDRDTLDLLDGRADVLSPDEIRLKLAGRGMTVPELASMLGLSSNFLYILIRDKELREKKIHYEYAIRYLIG